MSDLEKIIQQIKDEIRVDDEGKGKISVRGAARLSGASNVAIRKALLTGANLEPSQMAQFLIDEGFEGANLVGWAKDGIPDVAAGLIFEYYGYEADEKNRKKQAKQCCRAYRTIGIRVWMQQITGWRSPSERKLTEDEVCDICLLPSGRIWNRRFDEDYYEQLSKLTGLNQIGHRRPKRWGQLTDEWVYKLLPIGVREAVRQCREESGGWEKLHQFLSDDGLEVFKKHMDTLLLLMKAADTVNGVRRSLANLTASHYQYRLFEDCRKDGRLTISKRLNSSDEEA